MKHCIVKIENGEGVRYQSVELGLEPIIVGRNWGADVVIEDRFVDPDHLQIFLNEDDEILIRDLGSINGTLLKRKRVKDQPINYEWTQPIRLGDSKISLMDAEADPEPTLLRSSWIGLLSKWNSPLTWFVSLAIVVLVQLGEKYLNSNQAFDIYKALYQVWPALVGVVVIALFFGLISRVLKGENNFGQLWILSCWMVIVTAMLNFFIKVIRFNWQDFDAGQLLTELNGTLLFAVFLFALLSLISNLRFRSRLGITMVTAGLVVFSLIATDSFTEEKNKWTSMTRTESSTLPSGFLLRDESTYQNYTTETDSLFDQVDEEVERLAAIDEG
ncbi:MAG: FHA domain-containing protein [Pseudomonadota bacterium]